VKFPWATHRIILCETKEQAETILKKIDKYFKNVLSIELSKEKTIITNILENKINFLGFNIFAQSEFRNKNKIMGKAIPNMKKLNNKVRDISKLIRKINKLNISYESDPPRRRAVIVEGINSKIVGLSEYYKISTCSHIYKSLDQRIYNQAWHTWRVINGNKGLWMDFTIPSKEVANRKDRHKNRNDRLFAIKIDGIFIGLTKFQFTKSVNAMKFNNKMTPYTDEGRTIYEKRIGKKLPLYRGTYYTEQDLFLSHIHYKKYQNPLRNFEYRMNREYALLRDKGQCKCCGKDIRRGTLHCHHINPRLPVNEVNKVNNLATVCILCHKFIHNNILPEISNKTLSKIENYRNKLMSPTVESKSNAI